LKWVEPKERILMKYDPKTENIDYVDGIISDDRLKGLDKELAAYPFEGLGLWRSLVSRVTEDLVDKVMGERKEGRLDGMTSIKGMEEEDVRLNSRGKLDAEGKLIFPVVDAKRSWRDGAVGQEVTKYSKDKSWLLGDVVKNEGGESISTVENRADHQISWQCWDISNSHSSSYFTYLVTRV
jgi:A1 cistron-splicing factor AAR2